MTGQRRVGLLTIRGRGGLYTLQFRHWGVRMMRIATAIAVIASVCCLGAASRMNKSTDLVQSNFAAWNAHDADKVASLYTEDVIYEDVPFGLIAHGHSEMRKLAADFFAGVPDL